MPFGKRPAAETHGVAEIDFDLVYRELIRPATQAIGWTPVRMDDLRVAGSIEDQYLREIFQSELMLADISLPNGNVFYELGVRNAISSGATILLACKGTQLPFDIRGQRVLFYDPDPVGWGEARRLISDAIQALQSTPSTSPVRAFLERFGLDSSPSVDQTRFSQDLRSRLERATSVDQLVAVWQWLKGKKPVPVSSLLELATKLGSRDAWQVSVDVLRRAVEEHDADFEVHRQMGWHLSKLGSAHFDAAHDAFDKALVLNPNDPETLGAKGGLFKRQQRYGDAAQCYARGAAVSPTSLYMRVNEAAMAVLVSPQDAKSGTELYKRLLEDIESNDTLRSDSWAEIVMGEAAFAVGDIELARAHYHAGVLTSQSKMAIQSAMDQLEMLGAAGFRSDDADSLRAWLREQLGGVTGIRAERGPRHVRDGEKSLPVIVHVSDLHFGQRLDSAGNRVEMHRFLEGDYGVKLSAHLIRELKEFENHPNLVIAVSGDLTYQASAEEFKAVQEFLEELCAGLRIDQKHRIIIAPGNHDIHWPSAKTNLPTRFDNYISFLESFYGEKLFRALYPRLKWDLRVGSKRDEPHDIVGMTVIGGVAYASLNSCTYETEQHHYGFVGGKQLKVLEDLMLSVPADTLAKVAIVHHHLHPFPEHLDQRKDAAEVWMDLSTVRDAGLVERRLEKLGFDLVLHGHKHKAQLRETLVRDRNERLTNAQRLIVCGAGSTGVNGLELGGEPNHFEIVEVFGKRRPDVDFVRIEWRELPLGADADWLKGQRWTLRG